MSGIFGVFHHSGVPAERETLDRMSRATAHRGRDGEGIHVRGPMGMGHRKLLTTPESLRESQPLVDEHHRLVLTMDGRVDNREDLRRELTAHHLTLRDDTDAELVLKAYQLWGEKCPERLVGDFAFAVWDDSSRRLFCCRDALGVRPFYYFTNGALFAFASDPAAIFALPGVKKTPHVEGLADYLLNNFVDSEPTEFSNLYRLRPAHVLLVSDKGVQKSQYWDVNTDDVIVLPKPEDYKDAFLEVFERAIAAQLRSRTPTGVAFSGGFDSSSILCLIESRRKSGEPGLENTAYSAVFDGQPYDESHYMRSVQELWGSRIRWCRPQAPRPLWTLPQAIRGDAQPMNVPLAYPMQEVFDQAAQDGTRVLFGGLGGDDLLDAPMRLGAELLLKGRFLEAWRYTTAQSRFHTIPIHRPLEYCLLRPLLRTITPDWAKRAYLRLRRHPRARVYLRKEHVASGIARARAEPWYLRGRKFSTGSRRTTYNVIHTGYRVQALEWWDRMAAASGIEVRQPFYDRRFVEFVTRIPDERMVTGYEPKGLMRSALRPYFPDNLMQRRDKADFTTLINDCLIHTDAESAEQMLAAPALERLGVIDGGRARQTYREYRSMYSCRLHDNRGIDNVWELLSLEGWARRAFA
jgi:asparagine synthase (glutamine-hydrolysing)